MTDESISEKLPRWETDSIFPGLESEPYLQAVTDLEVQLDEFDQFLRNHQIGQVAGAVSDLDVVVNVIEGYLERMNKAGVANRLLRFYVTLFTETDSSNDLAFRRLSELESYNVRIQSQTTQFQAWLGKQNAWLPEVIASSASARAHAFFLQITAEQSLYMMSEAEEALAAELAASGINAWGNLHGKIWSTLSLPFERDGKVEQLPMSVIQNLAMCDPDEDVRQRAALAEVASWASMREPLAAALNGSKNAKIILNKRRGRPDTLHAALTQARIDRETLEVMYTAIEASLPSFHRYMKAKAVLLHKDKLSSWDVFAPVGQADRRFTFAEAQTFITTQFDCFSPNLGSFAKKAFALNWIDAEPRAGKGGGAFSTSVGGMDLSRILCNFDGSLGQVFVIAHELGHGFHNHCQAGNTRLQASDTMTLAESASLFCETLVTDQALASAISPQEELAILDRFLGGTALMNVVDTTQDFRFEQEVFARRAEAELSADEICEISKRCQLEVYGDGMDPDQIHPYLWAAMPHQFMAGISFYNFPYAFGMLFSLGLYAQYQRRGPAFVTDFEKLLARTGQVMPADLANQFGFDLRNQAFWQASLALIEERIQRFEELCSAQSNS